MCNLPGIGASSISSAHDPSAAVCQSRAPLRVWERGAYIGLPGSLPGTSSAVPSSWALQQTSLALMPHFPVAVQSGAKKAGSQVRAATAICALKANLPMIAVCRLRAYGFRALSESCGERRLLLSLWVVGGCGVCRCFVCGVSSSFRNGGNLKLLCVRWAPLSHPEYLCTHGTTNAEP